MKLRNPETVAPVFEYEGKVWDLSLFHPTDAVPGYDLIYGDGLFRAVVVRVVSPWELRVARYVDGPAEVDIWTLEDAA